MVTCLIHCSKKYVDRNIPGVNGLKWFDIFALPASPSIHLVELQLDSPRCPVPVSYDVADLATRPGLMRDIEVTLLDDADETCLQPFTIGQQVVLIGFHVRVPENGKLDVGVEVATGNIACLQPMMTVFVNHVFESGRGSLFNECALQARIDHTPGVKSECIFLCRQISPNDEGCISLFMRLEKYSFSETDSPNQTICGLSVQFPDWEEDNSFVMKHQYHFTIEYDRLWTWLLNVHLK